MPCWPKSTKSRGHSSGSAAPEAEVLARLAALAERYEFARAAWKAVDGESNPEAHVRAWNTHDRAYADFARGLREAGFRATRQFVHRGVAYAFTYRFGLFARTETDPVLASAYATEAPPVLEPEAAPGRRRRSRRRPEPTDAELEAVERRYREAERIFEIVLANPPLLAYGEFRRAKAEMETAVRRRGREWRGYGLKRNGRRDELVRSKGDEKASAGADIGGPRPEKARSAPRKRRTGSLGRS